MTKRFVVITLLGIILPAVELYAQNVVYVNQAATGANTGASWGDAFVFLQDALDAAQSDDEIWVAAGIYHPDKGANVTEGDRAATFQLMSGVALYGGFAGTETAREERDWELNLSILSGDLMMNDNDNLEVGDPSRSDNSYHVVSILNQSEEVGVDGFYITSGNANGPSQSLPLPDHDTGAGIVVIQSDAQFINTSIERNIADEGGGVWVQNSFVGFEYVIFQNNIATEGLARGGGLYALAANIELIEVQFMQNAAFDGGGIFNANSEALFIRNTHFVNNEAKLGGGIYNFGSSPIIVNAFFLNNESSTGGGAILNENDGNPLIANSIFSGNQSLNSVLFGGGAVMNVRSNPTFINCVFSANNSLSKGGAIYNRGRDSVFVANSIVWNNTADEGAQFYNDVDSAFPNDSSTISISHNIIQGELDIGVIDLGANQTMDPMFVDPLGQDGIAGTGDDNLRVQVTSPAIDSGDNSLLPSDVFDLDKDGDFSEWIAADIGGNQRIFSLVPTHRVDIGAYELDAPPASVSVQGPLESDDAPNLEIVVYPNPVKDRAVLNINSRIHQSIVLTAYDIIGRKISTVFSGVIKPGLQEIPFNTNALPNGLYLIILTSQERRYITQFVKVK